MTPDIFQHQGLDPKEVQEYNAWLKSLKSVDIKDVQILLQQTYIWNSSFLHTGSQFSVLRVDVEPYFSKVCKEMGLPPYVPLPVKRSLDFSLISHLNKPTIASDEGLPKLIASLEKHFSAEGEVPPYFKVNRDTECNLTLRREKEIPLRLSINVEVHSEGAFNKCFNNKTIPAYRIGMDTRTLSSSSPFNFTMAGYIVD